MTFTDELMQPLDLERIEREADVVGLTAMGPQIRRAYELADHFRARGKKVVLGGTWVTLTAEASLQHADAVVAGEAEYVWAEVLADLEAGRSRGIYRAVALARPAEPPRDRLVEPAAAEARRLPLELALPHVLLLAGRLLARLSASLRATAPCRPSTTARYRTRPVDDVIDDVRQLAAIGARRFLLLDDNPVARPDAAKELFRRLIPHRIEWVSQSTINVARDPELLDLVARSGASVLSIGFESLSEESLER